MSPPEIWGPPIWTFFHTLAENINEEGFPNIKFSLFSFIKRICSFLPCPDCSQHAIHFLAKVNINKITSKNDFKNMLYVFHNNVNKRKHKQLFSHANLEKYKIYNVGSTFNHFVNVYHTKGNMNLIAESFQRKLLVSSLKTWLIKNYKFFKPTKTQIDPNNNSTNENVDDNTKI
jgi:hypothetical protein